MLATSNSNERSCTKGGRTFHRRTSGPNVSSRFGHSSRKSEANVRLPCVGVQLVI